MIFLFFGLVLLSGIFNSVEMAIFSARRERILQVQSSGDTRGDIVLSFLHDPARILFVLQVGSTLISLLLGYITSITINAPVANWLIRQGMPVQRSNNVAFWVAMILSTLFIMVFAGAIPKKIGWVKADEVSVATARFAYAWQWLMTPVSATLIKITDWVVGLFGIYTPDAEDVSEADLRVMLQVGKHADDLDPREVKIIANTFDLSELRIGQFELPISKTEWIDRGSSDATILEQLRQSEHSFFPVFSKFPEEPVGVMSARKALSRPSTLWDDIMPPIKIDEEATLLQALELFESSGARLLFTQSGSTVTGILTIHDLMRALFGNLEAL